MSRIDRAGNPRTGTLRRRLLAGAMAAAVALSGLPARPVFAQDIVVSGGAVQSNSSPATYNSIDVSGTDGSSNPSTYNADAPLTLTGSLTAHDLGVFNTNADVSISSNANAYSGGVINLNAGTLTAQTIIFQGAGSVTRSAGNYSTNSLSLSNGATLGYESGDSIGISVGVSNGAALTLGKDLNLSGGITVDGAATTLASAGYALSADFLWVIYRATVTLDQNLTLSDGLYLQDGGAIARTSQTISALGFNVNDATLDLLAGDTFSSRFSSGIVQNGALVNAPAGTSLGLLNVSGTNGNGDRATFNANGDVSLVNASAYADGVINLNTGTLSAEALNLDGTGLVNHNGGNYSTDFLELSNGATLGYGSGDTISNSVVLNSGAALTLAKDLNVSGGITVDGAATSLASAGQAISAGSLSVNHGATVTLDQNLTLSSALYLQNGGSITRTSETISAPFFFVEDATLDLLASDTFSPGSLSYVRNGALVNAPAGTALGLLNVTGTNGNGDRATFNVNGDASIVSASASSAGVINLNTGTLSASQGLSFDGVGSVTRSSGSYSTNSLTLSNGATLGYGSGDTISNSVELNSGAALTLAKDLNVLGNITVDGTATSLASAGQAILAGSLSVNHGATVTLDQNLTLSSALYLQNGGSITRTSETISAPFFFVEDATLDLLASDTFSPGSLSYVRNGALVNAPAGTSLGLLNVSGTNGNGDRATFNVNGDASIVSASASSAGVINLNTGTLSASQGLSFDGVGSVTRSSGSYSTNSLTLSNGVTLGYGSGDTISNSVELNSGAALTLAKDLNLSGGITVDGTATSLASAGQAISAGSLSVNHGATVTLDQNLTLSSALYLQNGGSITRTSETISAPFFLVEDATLDLFASDTFSPFDSSSVLNGALVNAPAGTSLGYLYVTGTNGNGDRATFNVNGDVTVNGTANAYYDGIIKLNAGTLTAQSLYFDGAGSVTRSGGSYSTNNLTLSDGASLGYDAGDTINDSVSLSSGAALTLAKDLNVSGNITVDGAATSLASAGQAISAGSLTVNNGATVTIDQNLALDGYLNLENGGAIARTSEAISALAFSVDNATLDLLAGDSFRAYSYVRNGALVNAPAGTSLGSLYVTGTNGNGDRATFNVNGDASIVSATAYSDGVINLIAGTLSTPNLSLDGVGSAGQAGGNYDVTDLLLSGGATLTFGLGDSIDSLFISDAGSRLDQLAPLTLSSLSLSNGGVLHLGAFTGTGAIADWGLQMTGDDTVFLQGLIELGLLTAGLSPLSVIFDAGSNMTYVTLVSAPVPEIDPNTAHGAVVLLVGALGLLERRLRRNSGAVTLS